MNNYKQKQEAKKERYEAISDVCKARANRLSKEGWESLNAIPFGQPILVGHHSEKRDRAYRSRATGKIDKSVEERNKADYYESKAENIGKGGISSDDPEAIAKLKIKLAQREDSQKDMKEQNAEARALKTEKPFETYQLSNNNANIRTIKLRIKRLSKQYNMEEREDIKVDGFVLTENKEDNRIRFIFDGKPEEEVRTILKSNGFRWSPYNKAWQRMLNNNGRYATKRVINLLK